MTPSPDITVGELASRFPQTIPVFQRLRIEFCCEGHRRLDEICRERRLSLDDVTEALAAAAAAAPARRHDWSARPLVELTSHIVEAFHDPLRQELPRMRRMAAGLQGHTDPSKHVLAVVLYELERFADDLEPHMLAAEHQMFPLIQRLEAGDAREGDRVRFHQLRKTMEHDHQQAGQVLQLLHNVTARYQAPPHACAALRRLYRSLKELELLMQLHAHLEDNILIPRAAALLAA